jgi:hypothetical protein
MNNTNNDLLPLLVMNAAAYKLGIIDKATLFEMSNALEGLSWPTNEPPPNHPVLAMNDAALALKIINPTQHAQYKRTIEFREAREAAAMAAHKRGARIFRL